MVKDPPDWLDAMATKQAQKNTYTNAMESDWGKSLDQFFKSEAFGMQPLKFIAPFVRIGVNMTDTAIEHSPLALVLSKSYKEAIEKGGAAAQFAQAQVAFGSTVLGMSGLAAYNGLITGNGPKNYKMPHLFGGIVLAYLFEGIFPQVLKVFL